MFNVFDVIYRKDIDKIERLLRKLVRVVQYREDFKGSIFIPHERGIPVIEIPEKIKDKYTFGEWGKEGLSQEWKNLQFNLHNS